ncbi:protein phosphatase CheZ [Psychrosphaera ytuae]|uniref:Protein phosphatase CheZ n=1 Tax=Psychrosphaera ytuae TaxID=2820710 RepID=A0A975HI19_9GAMM|nr:protein phosphatase CheZ [Psychrosphaera ytuae]QTH63781.1 protein phosphatase CheZ [Psychrosphaera ytuae]
MSSKATPQISLDDAKALVAALEAGENESANEIVKRLTNQENRELFDEVGKLTRQLHDSLRNFQLDPKIANLATDYIPDAKERLNYVMNITEEAANKTMDAIDASLPLADKINSDVARLKPEWEKLMQRQIELGEFKSLCYSINDFMQQAETDTAKIHSLMTEILLAQDFQDLTGQVIKRVIELVQEVEESLIHLLTVFGEPSSTATNEAKKPADKNGAEGPIIDAETREDAVSSQDEVDDLLSSLGF